MDHPEGRRLGGSPSDERLFDDDNAVVDIHPADRHGRGRTPAPTYAMRPGPGPHRARRRSRCHRWTGRPGCRGPWRSVHRARREPWRSPMCSWCASYPSAIRTVSRPARIATPPRRRRPRGRCQPTALRRVSASSRSVDVATQRDIALGVLVRPESVGDGPLAGGVQIAVDGVQVDRVPRHPTAIRGEIQPFADRVGADHRVDDELCYRPRSRRRRGAPRSRAAAAGPTSWPAAAR